MITERTQVIIVGAGPTGLSLAAGLIRYGIDFVILEKNEKTTHLSKAVVIQARTLEIFDEWGLAKKAIEQGRPATAFNIFHNGKKQVTLNLAGLGTGLSHYPFALSLEQSKTEKLLVDHLAAHDVHVRWRTSFTRLEQSATGVKAFYTDATGEENIVEGLYLAGCDGAGSLVRHQLGLQFEGDTNAKIFYVADLTLSSPVVNKDELFAFLIPKGFTLFFPMEGPGHYRLIGILPDKKETDPDFQFKDIEPTIRQHMQVPIEFKELRWFSSYKVHSRKAEAFMKGRCFICGDAGHIHTPAGGQGMNTGIQDSYNLAWKLALVLLEKIPASVLETYNTERVQNAARLLRTTDKMFEFMTGSNSFRNFFRLQLFPPIARFISKNSMFNKKIFPLISQTGIAYPDSKLTIESHVGEVHAGDRIPYFEISGGRHIYQLLGGRGFKLLVFGRPPESLQERVSVLSQPPDLVDAGEAPSRLFGNNKNFLVLLRPDNHIAYIGESLDQACSFLASISTPNH